jgi:DNA repair exonuclease SbcCD ATPase subunit
MRLLVDILMELSRNGQQIILATHVVEIKDYDDLTEFDVRRAANDTEKEKRQESFKWPVSLIA